MVRFTVWPQLLLVILILRQTAAMSDECSELQAGISRLEGYKEHMTKQLLISQATSMELKKTEAVNIDLKKELEVLTKKVETYNQMSKLLCGTPENVCRSLIDAAKSGDVDSVKRLVKFDSNDNCTDDNMYRMTPLIYAVNNGAVEVVRVLLEGGANIDRANAYGSTALHIAAVFGKIDVCRLLLDWGAKVDRLDKWKNTPLHYAALSGRLSVVKLLVERGADVSVKDIGGKTASDWARSKGKKDVADWLDSVRRG